MDTDDLLKRLNELEEEAVCLRKEINTLAAFLITNFDDECGYGEEDCGGTAVMIAVRLLGELRERREHFTRQFEALAADPDAASLLADYIGMTYGLLAARSVVESVDYSSVMHERALRDDGR